ncbi:MAG: PIN domain-containing protein [Verrucomicrobia bacterium]|nr:MAG: PIN domain-containing protein [Verrucomicrobiota bacterium]
MILPDANLLLYACDESSPFHANASDWWQHLMEGSTPVILLPPVVFGFVRISTHPRIYSDPLSVAEASAHVRSWLARKHVRLHDMLLDDVEKALALLESAGTAGNLTTDAQIAAVALRLDAKVHTADLDFGRFAGVSFRNPLL